MKLFILTAFAAFALLSPVVGLAKDAKEKEKPKPKTEKAIKYGPIKEVTLTGTLTKVEGGDKKADTPFLLLSTDKLEIRIPSKFKDKAFNLDDFVGKNVTITCDAAEPDQGNKKQVKINEISKIVIAEKTEEKAVEKPADKPVAK